MLIDITELGARTQDILQTELIQSAIDECWKSGGGTVQIPAGIYRVGGLRLRSNVTLHLLSGAILEGSENPEDYCTFLEDKLEPLVQIEYEQKKRSATPLSRWNNAIIRAIDAENIAVVGEPYSYIDGKNCFDSQGEENYRGPHGFDIQNCRNVKLSGYTLRNTGNWAHAIFHSKNVDISHVTVYGGHDGIDIFLCEGVSIRDCRLDTGDDSIAGFGSRDVNIRDCIFNSSCSSIRFGGTDVIFERCKSYKNPPFGFRGSLSAEEKQLCLLPRENHRHYTHTAFLYYCDDRFGRLPYRPGNILLRDCDFDGGESIFHMVYGEHRWCNNHPLASIRYERCRIRNIKKPAYVFGGEDDPIDFSLSDVTLEAAVGSAQSTVLEAKSFKQITLERVKLLGYEAPSIKLYGSGELQLIDSDEIEVVRSENPEKSVGSY